MKGCLLRRAPSISCSTQKAGSPPRGQFHCETRVTLGLGRRRPGQLAGAPRRDRNSTDGRRQGHPGAPVSVCPSEPASQERKSAGAGRHLKRLAATVRLRGLGGCTACHFLRRGRGPRRARQALAPLRLGVGWHGPPLALGARGRRWGGLSSKSGGRLPARLRARVHVLSAIREGPVVGVGSLGVGWRAGSPPWKPPATTGLPRRWVSGRVAPGAPREDGVGSPFRRRFRAAVACTTPFDLAAARPPQPKHPPSGHPYGHSA